MIFVMFCEFFCKFSLEIMVYVDILFILFWLILRLNVFFCIIYLKFCDIFENSLLMSVL